MKEKVDIPHSKCVKFVKFLQIKLKGGVKCVFGTPKAAIKP